MLKIPDMPLLTIMPNIWFTSDTHFAHKNSMRYCGRPFFNVKACDEAMIRNWNAMVKPEDTIYHLGDVAMKVAAVKEILPRLNGNKILVIGNHDLMYDYFIKSRSQKFVDSMFKAYKDAGFEQILQSGTDIALADGDSLRVVRLCHFPTKKTEDKYHNDKHDSARPVDDGKLNICGHVHQNWLKRGNNINVGVDVWDFKPISAKQVLELYKYGPDSVNNPKPIRVALWTLFHTIKWKLTF